MSDQSKYKLENVFGTLTPDDNWVEHDGLRIFYPDNKNNNEEEKVCEK